MRVGLRTLTLLPLRLQHLLHCERSGWKGCTGTAVVPFTRDDCAYIQGSARRYPFRTPPPQEERAQLHFHLSWPIWLLLSSVVFSLTELDTPSRGFHCSFLLGPDMLADTAAESYPSNRLCEKRAE